MPSNPKRSIAELYKKCRVAIHNSLADPEVLALVGAYGYDAQRLAQGKQLLERSLQAYEVKEACAGAQRQATAETDRARLEAEDAFLALVRVARAVFKTDEPALTALALRGRVPASTAAFLGRADQLFDNARLPEVQQGLQAYGYDAARLQAEYKRINAYREADQVQEAAKGTAQQATADHDEALALLRDWIAQYIKIARIALRHQPKLLDKLGLSALPRRSKKPKASKGKKPAAGKEGSKPEVA
jgi:hypothetical protein